MPLSTLIPASVAGLGGLLLVVAVVLVFVDVPGKGVPWDQVGAVFALIGGFGVGGSAGGWIGRMLAAVSHRVLSQGQQLTAQAVGAGVVGGIVLGLFLWAYARIGNKGISTKSKLKSLIVVAALAVVGTILAGFPGVYAGATDFVQTSGTIIRSFFPNA